MMGLFEVMITKMAFKFGVNNLIFVRGRLILMLIVSQMSIIFVISVSNDPIINTIYA